jgi:preprotein translocase subunit SecG
LEYFLYGLFFLSCLVLITVVLLQPGKTDAGALFTSNVSSNAFGPRGTATVLSKTTIVAATVFMLSALMLSMPALTGNISVLSGNPDAPATTSPAANANVAVDTNSAVTAPTAEANQAPANTAPAANGNANK